MDSKDKVLTAVNWTEDPVLFLCLTQKQDPYERFFLIQSTIIQLVDNCGHIGISTVVLKADTRAVKLLELLWLVVDDCVRRDIEDDIRDERTAIRSKRAEVAMKLYLELREPMHHLIENFSATMKGLLAEVGSAWAETSDEEEASLLFSFLIEAAQGDFKSSEQKLVTEVIRERDSRCSLKRIRQAFALLCDCKHIAFPRSLDSIIEALVFGLAKRSIDAASGVHFVDLLLLNESSLPAPLWESIIADIRQATAHNTITNELVELLVNKFGPKNDTTKQWKLAELIPTQDGVAVTLLRDFGTPDVAWERDFRKSFEEAVDFVGVWLQVHPCFEIVLTCKAVFGGEPLELTEKLPDEATVES